MKSIFGINCAAEIIYKALRDNMARDMEEKDGNRADAEDFDDYRNYDDLNEEKLDTPIEGVDESELKNYATDVTVFENIKDILDNVNLARSNRQAKLEQDWERYRDIYNCRRTLAYYNGRSKLFLPAGKKSVDTLTRIQREAILSDPYLAVDTDVPMWQTVGTEFMKYLVETQGKIKQITPMFLRQLNTIGTSCMELSFEKICRKVKYRERGSDEIKERKVFTHYGPTYTVIDMKKVYVWPETATNYDGLQVVFKDGSITATQARMKADAGIYDKGQVEKAITLHSQILLQQHKADSQPQKELGTDLNVSADIDEVNVWAKFKLPGQDEPQWNLITLIGDVPVQIIENPWWFQMPPFLFGAIFREHDFFYGHGIIESMEMWQYFLNDTVNQTQDVGTFCLNPIITYDPALIDDPDLINLEPGAKIPDPNVKFERPPAQMALEGLQMVRFLLNIIQESTDANALVQGAPREGLGKAAGTATGVSQLMASANGAIMDQVEDLEAQVYTPLLQYTEIMAHEFMDEKMVLRIMGPDGIVLVDRVIEPSDLVLSTDIRWVASLRLREKFAKSQQALNFLNIAIGIPPQLTEQQGFRVNYKHLIKMVYTGTGLPDVDNIIEDIVYSLPGIPPEMEYELMNAGRRVEASPMDTSENHSLHIRAHMAYEPPTDLAKVRLQEHIASHMRGMQKAQAMEQAVAEQVAGNTAPNGPQAAQDVMGQLGAMLGGGGTPLRPQEQPTYANEGAASQGIGSQMGGATGMAGGE